MKIASQHAKAISESPWIGMEKWLFLDGIALHSAHIAPGHVELPALVEANFTDPSLSVCDGTTMSTGVAAQAIAFDGFVQFTLADVLIQNFAKG
jgi:hypothetical protein